MRALHLVFIGMCFLCGLVLACARTSAAGAGSATGQGRAASKPAPAPASSSSPSPSPSPSPSSGTGPAGKAGEAPYRIETLTLTPQPALTMRAQVAPEELEAKMREIMTKLVGYAMMNGIEMAGPPFARYHTRTDERMDVEAGIPTIKPLPGNAALGIESSALPAGPAIATVHRGAYEALSAAHEALARWARARGRSPAGGAWEVFLTNPVQERDPARWRTKVILPLRADKP